MQIISNYYTDFYIFEKILESSVTTRTVCFLENKKETD